MCGRYYIDDEESIIEIREIIEEVNRKSLGEKPIKTGEICPTNNVPVLIAEGGKTVAIAMCWGFPKWTGAGVLINARSETVHEKKTFASSVRERRAVIPTTGFYEWRHEGEKKKQKYLFREQETPILYLAGVYNSFTIDEAKENRFTILTAAANESMVNYHDRMPVILEKSEIEKWLHDESYTDVVLHKTLPQLMAMQEPHKKEEEPQQLTMFS